MNRMIQSIGLWWDGRSAREQKMLAVMGLLIAAVLIWLLAVRPAFAWREAAAERRVEATAGLARIEAGLASRWTAQKKAAMPLAEVEQAACLAELRDQGRQPQGHVDGDGALLLGDLQARGGGRHRRRWRTGWPCRPEQRRRSVRWTATCRLPARGNESAPHLTAVLS